MNDVAPSLDEPVQKLESVLAPAVVEALELLIDHRVQVALELTQRERQWLTLEEAAERYRTTAAALRKRAQRGSLPGAVRDGARWLVEASALDRALLCEDDAQDKRAPAPR